MARNLQALLPLVLEFGPGRIAFCTDDRDPEDIADERPRQRDGARGGRGRRRARGRARDGLVPPGAVARARPPRRDRARLPGRPAPAPRPRQLRADLVLKRGRADRGRLAGRVPEWVRQTVRIKPVSAADFAIPSDGGAIRAIGLIEDQVVTRVARARADRSSDGHAVADAERRPREDRRRRAPPRDGSDRARLRLRLGPAARRARLVGRPRRAQPRRRRDERRRHGVRRQRTSPRSAAASSWSTTAASSPSARSRSPASSPTPRSPT